ncbi:MAG: hypothetical protein JJT87_19105 [Halomonas sp.]|nr:hypothetical protein [Halomonas sp.]
MNAADQPQPLPWAAVAQHADFQNADWQTRQKMRNNYLDRVVRPIAKSEADFLKVRDQFFTATESDVFGEGGYRQRTRVSESKSLNAGYGGGLADQRALDSREEPDIHAEPQGLALPEPNEPEGRTVAGWGLNLGRGVVEGATGSIGAAVEGVGIIAEQTGVVESNRQVDDAIKRLETTQQQYEAALGGTNDAFHDDVEANYQRLLDDRTKELHQAMAAWAEREPNKAAQWLRDRGVDLRDVAQSVGPDDEYRGVATDVAGGLGSMLTYMGPGLLAGALTRGSSAAAMGTAVGMAGPSGVSEQFQRAKAAGLDEEAALEKSMQGFGAGAIQVAPLAAMIRPLPAELQGKAIGQLYGIMRAAGSEAIVEGAGGVLQNLIEQSYNPERGTWDDTAYQAAISGGSAGLLQAGVQVATRGRGMNAGAPKRRETDTEQSGIQRVSESDANAEWEAAWREQAAEDGITDFDPSANIPDTTINVAGQPTEAAEASPVEVSQTEAQQSDTEQQEVEAAEPTQTIHHEDDTGARLIRSPVGQLDPIEQRARERLLTGDGYAYLRERAEGNEAAVAAVDRMQVLANEGDADGAAEAYKEARQLLQPVEQSAPEAAGLKLEEHVAAIDQAANETNTEPAPAQAQAGNYRKGHIKLNGFDIAIENPKGSTRRGTAPDGTQWESHMAHHYGDIKGTEAADGDNLDVFVGDHPGSPNAYIIDQLNEDGSFDEHKIMLGFDSSEAAQQGYLANYEDGWQGLGKISELSVEDLKHWVNDGDTRRPFALSENTESLAPDQPSPTPGRMTPKRVPVADIQVDPEAYQFRTNVNQDGVDSRLEGVEKWDDLRAGNLVLHERLDGTLYAADGHHRINLARQLEQPDVNALVLREADGVTVEDARIEAATANIAAGNATAIDAAKVFRNTDVKPVEAISRFDLPRKSPVVRDGIDIAKLANDAFGSVLNGVVTEKDGAAIGRAFSDPDQQMAAIEVFQRVKPSNENQRALLANEVRQAGFARSQSEQGGLFGDDPAESLIGERVRVMDNLRQSLVRDRRLFATLNENAQTAEKAGNRIAKDRNSALQDASAEAVALLERATTTPEINQQINDAARRVKDGEPLASVTRELKETLLNGPDTRATEQPRAPTLSSRPANQAGQDAGGSAEVSGRNDARAARTSQQRVGDDTGKSQATVTLKADGKPFLTRRAVELSKRFRDTQNAQPVEVEGGWGFAVWDAADAAITEQQTSQPSSIAWRRRSNGSRVWEGSDGTVIADHSMGSGGSRIPMFMVFADKRAYDQGNNFTTGKTLTEAKQLALSAERPDALSDSQPASERQASDIAQERTPDEIRSELNRVMEPIEQRYAEALKNADPNDQLSVLDFATDAEQARRHELILSLPSAAQERAQARERIIERRAARQQEPLLETQTEESLAQREQQVQQAEQAEADQRNQEAQRAQADREADDFVLSGSNRPNDIAESRGQNDIFSTPPSSEPVIQATSLVSKQRKPKKLTPRQQLASDAFGGAMVGDTIKLATDVGYSKAGDSYTVDSINKDGTLQATSVERGSSVLISQGEWTQATRRNKSPIAEVVSSTEPAEASVGEDALFSMRNSGSSPTSTAWQRAEAKGLDMSQEGRMKRAREMGYIGSIEDAIAGEVSDNGQIISRRDQEGRINRGNDAATEYARPLTVYHGTAGDIDGFQRGHRDQYDAGWLGQGIYVTTNPEQANVYAKKKSDRLKRGGDNVLPLHIKPSALLKLPADSKRRLAQAGPATTQAFSESLKSHGYDGVVVEYGDTQEIVLFDESNIRSTQAAFDPEGEGSNDLLFSTREGGSADALPASAENAPAAVDIAAALANTPELAGTHIIQTTAELPPQALLGMMLRGVNPSDVRGMFIGDELYVVADNVQSVEEGVQTAIHEAVGHKGIRGVLGDELVPVMRQVYDSLPRDPRGREALNEVLESYPFLDQSNPEHQITIAEEMVAHLAEKGWQPSVLRRAVAKIRELLRRYFPNMNWTDADVMQLSERSREYLRRQQREGEGNGETDIGFSLNNAHETTTAGAVQSHLNEVKGIGRPKVLESADNLALDVGLESTIAGVNPQDAIAFYHGDDLYVIANNAADTSEAVRATLSTAVGHKGLRATLGNRADAILTNVVAQAQKSIVGREALRGVRAEYDHLSIDHTPDQVNLGAELLARMSELSDPPAFVQEASTKLDDLLQSGYPNAGFTAGDGQAMASQNRYHLQQQQRDFGQGKPPYSLPYVFSAQDGPGRGTLLDMNTQVVDANGDIVSDARIDGPFKSAAKFGQGFFESATDRLRRSNSPVLQELAKRVDAYFDQAEARLGMVNGILREPLKRLRTLNPIERRRNMRDFESYMRHRDNGREADAKAIADRNSAVAELAEAVDTMFDQVGTINQTVKTPQGTGMRVFDSKTGAYRKIGKFKKGGFWPRALRPEVQRVMHDPTSNNKLWHELLDALVDEGHANTRKEAAEYLRGNSGYFSSEITSDYFAGIEKARGEKLPEMFYDYRFDVVSNYARKWSDRISQVEQFGQKIGPMAKDAFEEAASVARDQRTKDYIGWLADRVYNRRPTDAYHELMANANLAATGLQLGNPGTATLNIIGGTQLNVQMFGSKRMAKAYLDLAMDAKNIYREGVELGILGKDVLNILRDADNRNTQYMDANSKTKEWLGKFSAGTMKWGGYTGTEQIIRATGMIAARAQLMDALHAWNKRPHSRDARTYRKFMERNRIDVAKLLRENGKGEETGRYLRLMVNIPQGSYRVDQTPIYVDTPMGRFFFKYQKFGTQVSRLFWQQKLKPMMDAWADPHASTTDKALSVLPILQWIGWSVLGGGAVLAARGAMFGYVDPGPELDEIKKAVEDDGFIPSLGLMAAKAHANMIAGSAYGFFGNYIQMAKDVADQQRVKNPLSPPGLAPIDAGVELLQRWMEQDGRLYAADLNQVVERQISLYRTSKRGLAALGNQVGFEVDFIQLEQARRDLQYIRKAARRFASESGIEATRTSSGRFGLTENTAANREIVNAILIGDGRRAAALVDAALDATQTKEEELRRKQSIRSMVRARHPVQLGGPASEEEVYLFLDWAEERLPASRAQFVREVIERYESAAYNAGL